MPGPINNTNIAEAMWFQGILSLLVQIHMELLAIKTLLKQPRSLAWQIQTSSQWRHTYVFCMYLVAIARTITTLYRGR